MFQQALQLLEECEYKKVNQLNINYVSTDY